MYGVGAAHAPRGARLDRQTDHMILESSIPAMKQEQVPLGPGPGAAILTTGTDQELPGFGIRPPKPAMVVGQKGFPRLFEA